MSLARAFASHAAVMTAMGTWMPFYLSPAANSHPFKTGMHMSRNISCDHSICGRARELLQSQQFFTLGASDRISGLNQLDQPRESLSLANDHAAKQMLTMKE